ncbi:MAG TPA: isocitrate lyase/PEP mutase family protein [Candidatus Dormibacteraeota bacterium]|nr:isocitrate lyase/PEP mutase family protein [Candidatus Dormibacteraeota bacterium]
MEEHQDVPAPEVGKRRRLRELLSRDEVLVMPGGFSPVYAKMAQLAGFEAFFLAGSQTAAYVYGLPDVGVMGLGEMADHARRVAASCEIPVLVDGDTGYGNAVGVHYAVREMIRAGVAGMQIEDQEAPKKSGTSAGRRLISLAEAVGKYRAAVDARDALDPEFVICARCDAIGAENAGFEEAIERCRAYATEGGVDLVWLNSVQTLEQVGEACRHVPAPLLVSWGGDGASPSWADFQRLGVRVVLYPVVASRAAAQFAWQLLNELRERGPMALQEAERQAEASRWGRVKVEELVGTHEIREIEERYLPRDLQRDYEHTFGHRPGGA